MLDAIGFLWYLYGSMKENTKILEGFVVFEGIDGTGTTTQLKRLDAYLCSQLVPHETSFEPTNAESGLLIRQALAGGLSLDPKTVAYLFAADRCEHVYGKKGIREQCLQGKLVISDRYLFSSLAYQGITCGRDLPGLLNASFPLPELLFFFELHPETAMKRMESRKSLEIYETLPFQEKVALEYCAVIESFRTSPMKIVTIDASMKPDEIEAIIRLEMRPLLEKAENPR